MNGKYVKPGLQSFYSAEQVEAYLRRISFNGDISSLQPNLTNLEQLVRLHLVALPFENSRLHYAADHEVDVSPQYVYTRLVEKRMGGSWCCGHNGLLLGMLRGLGYRVFASSGRVNQSPRSEEARDFTFLSHMVLLVQLEEDHSEPNARNVATDTSSRQQTYLVDVGFGGTGIVRPMLLEAGTIISGSAPPEEHRLIRGMHPDSSFGETEPSREWVVQYRCGLHQPAWTTLYMFGETETYTSDWIAYSQWLCAHPVALFEHNVFAVRHFIVEDISATQGEMPLGRLVMTGRSVRRTIGAESQKIREFATESDRVRILREDFGITVDAGEVRNIKDAAALAP
ncbi:hypothetical protein JB92DRAFT_3138701 [Gautieria morchelliformis]|nr:hypothetical protein JB92DRAFT_3138701 [Gautieria morchelliformis]